MLGILATLFSYCDNLNTSISRNIRRFNGWASTCASSWPSISCEHEALPIVKHCNSCSAWCPTHPKRRSSIQISLLMFDLETPAGLAGLIRISSTVCTCTTEFCYLRSPKTILYKVASQVAFTQVVSQAYLDPSVEMRLAGECQKVSDRTLESPDGVADGARQMNSAEVSSCGVQCMTDQMAKCEESTGMFWVRRC